MIRLPCPPPGVPESCQERRDRSGRAHVPSGTPRPLAPGQLLLGPTSRSGRSHSFSPRGRAGPVPGGSSGLSEPQVKLQSDRAHLGLDQGSAALQAEAELFRLVEARLARSAARAP